MIRKESERDNFALYISSQTPLYSDSPVLIDTSTSVIMDENMLELCRSEVRTHQSDVSAKPRLIGLVQTDTRELMIRMVVVQIPWNKAHQYKRIINQKSKGVYYNRTPRTNLLLAIADSRDPAPAGTFDISALSNADAEKLASLMSLKLEAELP